MWAQLAGEDRFPHVAAALPHMVKRDVDETFELGLTMILGEIERAMDRAPSKQG